MIGTSDGQQFPDMASLEMSMLDEPMPGSNDMVHVIRHGSTDYNSDEKVRSWSNVPLNEDGKQESLQVADEMGHHAVDVIYHSDLDRAADTASDVAATTGAELIPMKGLRSWNAGNLTGQHYSQATPVMEDYAYNKPDKKLPGGESFNEFKDRVLDTVAEAELHANGRNAAIVTHRGVERLLNAWNRDDDSIHLPTFFAAGQDTGSHQMMPIFGAPRHEHLYNSEAQKDSEFIGPLSGVGDYMPGMTNDNLAANASAQDFPAEYMSKVINDKRFAEGIKDAPLSENIEDRRDLRDNQSSGKVDQAFLNEQVRKAFEKINTIPTLSKQPIPPLDLDKFRKK